MRPKSSWPRSSWMRNRRPRSWISQLYKIAQLEIKKILDELREKKKEAEQIEEILASKAKLWRVVKDELNALGEKYGDRRRTRMATDEDVLEFDEEAYILKDDVNVLLTRDGWIKRLGRRSSIESVRIREGDEIIAIVPGSTLDHVVFLADDGAAYTMRINEVPATSGYGEPIAKFFKLADQARVLTALATDERWVPAEVKARKLRRPCQDRDLLYRKLRRQDHGCCPRRIGRPSTGRGSALCLAEGRSGSVVMAAILGLTRRAS